MIIVSQSKLEIVNFDEVAVILANTNANKTCAVTAYYTTGKSTICGNYKTEERAKDVLREIIEIHRVSIPTAVYEMPLE